MICELVNTPIDGVLDFGGKATALATLINNGLKIPEGYALSTDVFDVYLKHNEFNYSSDMYLSHNDEIQDLLINGKFPAGMKTELRNIFNKLSGSGKTPLAIRSSAICEDSGSHSMAGVFESFLNIKSYDEFECSIKMCYASLFSDKALSLMLRNRVKLEDARMGVVIQKYIEGSLSGVIFTADTINMDDNVVVINMVKGTCSGFVDGIRKSSYYRIDKSTAKILDVKVPDEVPFITEDVIHMLLLAAEKIEKIFGRCQDIEWTIRGNELYILQARPITTLRINDSSISWGIPDKDADKMWTLSSHEPLTPLAEELLYIYNQGITDGMLESCKAGGYFTQVLNGYPYCYIVPRDLDKRKLFRKKLDEMNYEGRDIFQDVVLPELMKMRCELDLYVNVRLHVDELLDYIKKALLLFQKAIHLHVLAVDGSMYLEEFRKYCTAILPDISEDDYYGLVFGKTLLAIEREHILKIAGYVKSNEKLISLFHDKPYNEVLYAHLTRYESGMKLCEMIRGYLKEYGLISVMGHGHIVPEVLHEQPWEVLSKIRACMGMDEASYYDELNKTLINKRMVINKICALLDEDGKSDFHKRLNAAEKAFLVNDDHCFYIDLTSQGYLRLALKEAGEILAGKAVVDDAEDIYFLKLDEIFDSLAEKLKELRSEIGVRKKLYNIQKVLIPPEYLGKAAEKAGIASTVEDKSCILKGISGLGKKVMGRVKVIHEITENPEIIDDCILVLPQGHGCYFLPFVDKIKGLIYDEGSPFDHPGILAREFAIPSLYKTGNATKVLRDGNLVELDGTCGTVRIISES